MLFARRGKRLFASVEGGNLYEACCESAYSADLGRRGRPVTLNFFTEGNSAILAETIERLVKGKYPNVTLNTIKSAKGSTIEEVMGAGTPIDLLSYSLGGLGKVKDYKLVSDLTPFIQKYGFDLNRYANGVVDIVKSYSEDGAITVLPFELNNNVIFYNKGIFDKFGVSYPPDGMTWGQTLDLAKKVTRTDGGVEYKGFQLEGINLVYRNQLGLAFVDPKTMRAAVNNDSWKTWVETMNEFYKIPGNEPTNNFKINFLTNQTLAMSTGPNFLTEVPDAAAKGLDWDVVSLPRFEGVENKAQMNATSPSSLYNICCPTKSRRTWPDRVECRSSKTKKCARRMRPI
ncbi:MAG: family 1 extracellular solute-binding protein [Paenibacillus sp.]|nr:family 1 extracellular solute-binding protein [Paenibacillus sp.]